MVRSYILIAVLQLSLRPVELSRLSPLPGLPPPHSNTLPVECEDILRTQGVTPATIAILNGRIKVGLEGSQLDELAEKGFAAKKDGGAKLWKVGRRELGAAVVKVSLPRRRDLRAS